MNDSNRETHGGDNDKPVEEGMDGNASAEPFDFGYLVAKKGMLQDTHSTANGNMDTTKPTDQPIPAAMAQSTQTPLEATCKDRNMSPPKTLEGVHLEDNAILTRIKVDGFKEELLVNEKKKCLVYLYGVGFSRTTIRGASLRCHS